METVFAKAHGSVLGSLAKVAVIFGRDVGVANEAIASDGDFQCGDRGAVEELPMFIGLQFFIPTKIADRFGASEERIG